MKRILCLLIALVACLSVLSGCGESGDKPASGNSQATLKPTGIPGTIELTFPTEATELETEPVSQSYPLVADALDASDPYASRGCYHIPRVNLPEDLAYKVNERIYDELYGLLEESDSGFGIMSMRYAWGQMDHIVSIIVEIAYDTNDIVDYLIYNVSTETGKDVHVSELYEAFNMTESYFYDEVRATLEGYWESYAQIYAGLPYMDSLKSSTLADSNIKESQVYINETGRLGFVAKIYSPAGASTYDHIFNLGSPKTESIECPGNH